MSNRKWMLVAAVLAGFASPVPATAEDACLADAQRLCSSTPPGDGRVYFCLKSSWNQLSDGCKALLDWSRNRANEVALDCQGDAFAYCQGVPAGQRRLYACLAAHRDRISSECRKGMEIVDWFTASCGQDVSRLCSGVPRGDGAVIACLVTRRDQLSRDCQAVFWP